MGIFIETRRNIWQNMFWGVSGTLDWEHVKLPKEFRNLDIYKRVDEFTQGVDLETDKWHSGMVKLDNQHRWKYKKSYRDDCIRMDELADVVYLRKDDGQKAFGVITNRRANYYTKGTGECTDNTTDIPAPEHSKHGEDNLIIDYSDFTESLRFYGPVAPLGGNNRLRLRNMGNSLQEFKIKYYSPYDLQNSIMEETRWGPKLTLEFPILDTLDIVLFEAFRMGENFKSMLSDTDEVKDSIQKTKKQEIDEVKIYPNPNDGKYIIFVNSPNKIKAIYISNNLGQRVDSRREIFKENRYNKTVFNSGVYIIEVVYLDSKTIRKKMIIN